MLTNRLNTAVMCLGLMAAPVLHAQVSVINPKLQHGAAVEAKVRQMIASNAHLSEAVARLEARGTKSHPEAATVISGILVRTVGSVTSSSLPITATATISGDNVEIDFIPNTYYYGYWDGTVDAKLYDANGTLLDEYIGNVTGESADPSNGLNCTYEDVVYGYDYGGDYGGGGGGPYQMSVPNPEKGERQRTLPGQNDGVRASRAVSATRWLGHWRDWAGCSGAWCAGAAAGCGIANAVDAEIGWLPCTAAGCITAAIGCTHGSLWN